MAEVAKKKKVEKLVRFPKISDNTHFTMSEEELQKMIQDIAAAAQKSRKRRPRPTYSLYTKDGRRKPTPADPIRSKEDFWKLADYLGSTGDSKFQLRNKTIFIFGCSIGVRCGDLLNLKTSDVYEPDGSVKEHLELMEEKTRKINVCKIPKMAVDVLEQYRDEQKFTISPQDYLFRSRKNGPLNVRSFYHILKDAGVACGLDIDLSTHTMRKTYAMAALQTAEGTEEAGDTLELLQVKFKHSDKRVTMRYIKADQDKVDKMSDRVSEWFDDGGTK